MMTVTRFVLLSVNRRMSFTKWDWKHLLGCKGKTFLLYFLRREPFFVYFCFICVFHKPFCEWHFLCAERVCAFHHLDEGKVFYNLYEENQLNFMWLSNLLLLLHHIIIRYYMLLNERWKRALKALLRSWVVKRRCGKSWLLTWRDCQTGWLSTRFIWKLHHWRNW